MSPRYPHLLSPIKVGNIVFKNRLTATSSKPYFIQSPERYPTEAVITHFANKAKNGAGLVTCSTVGRIPFTYDEKPKKYVSRRSISGHYDVFEPFDTHYQHMLSQLSEGIHFYGSKASMQVVLGPHLNGMSVLALPLLPYLATEASPRSARKSPPICWMN